MISDGEILRQYADHGDEAAFAEAVRRHTDLVYSVALRVTLDRHLAEDVTQKVFLKLAREAGKLCAYDTIVGWLHLTARHAAIDAIRSEERRRAREQEALTMQQNSSASDVNWEQLRPVLDEAVEALPEDDRKALLLRFFKGFSHQDVGLTLGLSENAARKRGERALEKLRAYFANRGVTASAALLGSALSANSVQAAPAGLAVDVTKASLAGAGGSTLGKFFLLALLMSTKTKVILGSVVLLAIGAVLTLSWPASDGPLVARASLPASATTSHSETSASAAPVVTPAAVPTTAPTVEPKPDPNGQRFVAEPKSDLKSAIATGLHFFEAKELPAVYKTLNSPGAIEAMRASGYGSTVEEIAEAVRTRHPEIGEWMQLQLEIFRAIQGLTPAMSPDGNRAMYRFDSPDGAHLAAYFIKVDGFWYYGTGTQAEQDALGIKQTDWAVKTLPQRKEP